MMRSPLGSSMILLSITLPNTIEPLPALHCRRLSFPPDTVPTSGLVDSGKDKDFYADQTGSSGKRLSASMHIRPDALLPARKQLFIQGKKTGT
jgi:hypothetical protein